ncbi:FixH family protein [Desulfurispirillum indicum]|uniref:FixH family protein n=1 Tax=Desulfurispirillum indicum TaxID=936456 RepID=UPI001CFB624F|nr:FixH family protein [Desulfurispirillum indicum]UCZ56187.1 FixH family protein [Desulfurispirillum indicum]
MLFPKSAPWLVIAILFAAFFLFSASAIHRAFTGVSAVTDPLYYQHGLKYYESVAEKRMAATLGWVATAELAGRQLSITLRDGTGAALEGGTARLELATAQGAMELALEAHPQGAYEAALPADLSGEVHLTFSFARDESRISRNFLVHLGE